jgi:hypothetical protein
MRFAAGIAMGTLMMLSCGLVSAAQSDSSAVSAVKPAEVSFQFERTGLAVPRFALRIREDGTGSYEADEMEGPADGGSMYYTSAKHVERTLKLTPPTVAKIFKTARDLNRFDMVCESRAKNIANTGKKTLSYAGADGAGSCTYNFSANKDIQELTNTFLSIAFTLDEGRKLEFLHRYDRLGLDAEMIGLEQAARIGHALELGTIAPVLNSIAADTAVMERVRLQAAKLLEQAGSNKI